MPFCWRVPFTVGGGWSARFDSLYSCRTTLLYSIKGGRETFTFFVTDTGNSQALLSIQLWYRPLRPPTTPAHASRHSGANIQTPPPPPQHRETSGLALPPGPGNGNGNGSRPGDVVIGEGFVDLLGLFPVIQGTYTPGALKGNARRVAVPLREPEGKR